MKLSLGPTLLKGSYFFLLNLLLIPFFHQVQSREWDIITDGDFLADALSEKDHQKLATCSLEESNEKKRLKILNNALKICRADQPNEVIIEATPELAPHPTRNFKGMPVLVFTKIHCISSDNETTKDELAAIDLFLRMFPSTSQNVEECTSRAGLNTQPTDILSIIIKNLNGADVVSLSKVSTHLRDKISKMLKGMKFVIGTRYSINRITILEDDFRSYFNGPINNVQDLVFETVQINPDLLNQLPKSIRRLSFSESAGTHDNLQLGNSLSAMRPENFPNLQELGIELFNHNPAIPLDSYLRFPKLSGLGTKDYPIVLTNADFIALPERAGARLTSLSIKDIVATPAELTATLNGLPNLKRLNFGSSQSSYAISLTAQNIESLVPNPNMKSLSFNYGARNGGVRCEDMATFVSLLEKFQNLKTISMRQGDYTQALSEDVDFSRWKKLEKLEVNIQNNILPQFWSETLPKLKQLKVLSVTPPAQGQDQDKLFSALKGLSGIEKLYLRNELSSDGLKALAKSGSRVRELWLANQCYNYKKGGIMDMAFFELTKLSDLRVLYVPASDYNKDTFQECQKAIKRMSGGRIHLKRAPKSYQFAEDNFSSDEDL